MTYIKYKIQPSLQVGSGSGEKVLDPASQKSSEPDPNHCYFLYIILSYTLNINPVLETTLNSWRNLVIVLSLSRLSHSISLSLSHTLNIKLFSELKFMYNLVSLVTFWRYLTMDLSLSRLSQTLVFLTLSLSLSLYLSLSHTLSINLFSELKLMYPYRLDSWRNLTMVLSFYLSHSLSPGPV